MQDRVHKEVLRDLVGVLRLMEACPACEVPDSRTGVEKRPASRYTPQMLEGMENKYAEVMRRAKKLLDTPEPS